MGAAMMTTLLVFVMAASLMLAVLALLVAGVAANQAQALAKRLDAEDDAERLLHDIHQRAEQRRRNSSWSATGAPLSH